MSWSKILSWLAVSSSGSSVAFLRPVLGSVGQLSGCSDPPMYQGRSLSSGI